MAKTRPSKYLFCEQKRNMPMIQLCICQHGCKSYPCPAAEEAEMALMLNNMPYRFNRKGNPVLEGESNHVTQ